MCGHCSERAALSERLTMAPMSARDADPLLLSLHLQEADDWQRMLSIMPVQDDDLVIAIVALCRTWTQRHAGGTPVPLRDLLSPALHARLDHWLASLDLPDGWAWLRDPDDDTPTSLRLDAAREELDAYLAGWLQVSPGAGAAWDHTTLHERLPRLSAALDVVCGDAPDDGRLILLALSSPGAASPFSAVDLWLQRRATGAVIAHHGIAFVLPLLDRWRSATLLAAVLRGELDHEALHALRDALARRPDDGTEGTRELRIAVERELAA
jgi:hypothetical protein